VVSMTSGPERPDAAKGDQKIAGRHGFEIGHPRRSLPGEQCGNHECVVEFCLHQDR
jgi:hypothetical protein